jgi:hypothetical protein
MLEYNESAGTVLRYGISRSKGLANGNLGVRNSDPKCRLAHLMQVSTLRPAGLAGTGTPFDSNDAAAP